MMSATPIPRTLAMTFYADLDVSAIDEMPPGRTPVATRLVNNKRRAEVIERVRRACAEGRQAYWVCPLIEESEKLELQTAVALHAELTAVLPEFTVGLLHGRMKPDDKAAVMAEFVAGKVHVLVATTVIEVGVDVPNASLMAIEHAERFGLAQLHQLRGRVGRGAEQSYCVLVSRAKEELTESAHARLQALVDTSDGFELAEVDLDVRGGGALLGTRQSGLSDLRFAQLRRDRTLLERARAEAPHVAAGPLRDAADVLFAEVERETLA
jgi:ATP-dependent DNA helicase RecG